MSEKSSAKPRQWLPVILLAPWAIVSFVAGSILAALIVSLIARVVPFNILNPSIQSSVLAAASYLCAGVLALGIPWLILRSRTTRSELGLARLLKWSDIGLAPAAFIIYLITSGVVMWMLQAIFPHLIDYSQAQETGFTNLVWHYEYILAFLTLVIIAPLAEETLFRGYLYGKLRKYAPIWLSMVLTSVAFAVLHLPGQLDGQQISLQWNVAIDVFILSLALTGLREITGSIWAGVLVHMIKNGIAFYVLFINTGLLH